MAALLMPLAKGTETLKMSAWGTHLFRMNQEGPSFLRKSARIFFSVQLGIYFLSHRFSKAHFCQIIH